MRALALGDAGQHLQQALPPTRQGTHLPHDSAVANWRKYLANSTMQVSSSTTIMPPEPIVAPAAVSESKSTGVFSAEAGQTAAQRAAGLHGLELLAVGDAAADVEDDLAQRDAHRHFDQAGVVDLAGQGEDGGAGRLLGADGLEPLGALQDDLGRHGVALDVVDVGRLAPQAGDGREGRAGPRLAALAFDGGHQRGLLAADERAGAFLDLQVEGEAGAEDVLAQQAVLVRLLRWPSSGARWPADTRRGSRCSPRLAPIA